MRETELNAAAHRFKYSILYRLFDCLIIILIIFLLPLSSSLLLPFPLPLLLPLFLQHLLNLLMLFIQRLIPIDIILPRDILNLFPQRIPFLN